MSSNEETMRPSVNRNNGSDGMTEHLAQHVTNRIMEVLGAPDELAPLIQTALRQEEAALVLHALALVGTALCKEEFAAAIRTLVYTGVLPTINGALPEKDSPDASDAASNAGSDAGSEASDQPDPLSPPVRDPTKPHGPSNWLSPNDMANLPWATEKEKRDALRQLERALLVELIVRVAKPGVRERGDIWGLLTCLQRQAACLEAACQIDANLGNRWNSGRTLEESYTHKNTGACQKLLRYMRQFFPAAQVATYRMTLADDSENESEDGSSKKAKAKKSAVRNVQNSAVVPQNSAVVPEEVVGDDMVVDKQEEEAKVLEDEKNADDEDMASGDFMALDDDDMVALAGGQNPDQEFYDEE